MSLDDLNILCAEIAQEEAEKRMAEYARHLEEEELNQLNLQYQQEQMADADSRFYGVVGECEGCYDYQDA